jgi:hypothetical protein
VIIVLRVVTLACEAHFPLRPGQSLRERGIVRVRLMSCLTLGATVKEEFWLDLERPYENGNTLKANEIIQIRLMRRDDDSIQFDLVSDMMQLGVECQTAAINDAEC